jgi:hypothetical protein
VAVHSPFISACYPFAASVLNSFGAYRRSSSTEKVWKIKMTTEASEGIAFRYSIVTRLFNIIFNISAFLAPVYLVGKFAFQFYDKYQSLSFSALLPVLLYSLFLGIVLVITANFYSEIIADGNSLHVQFLWFRLPVFWQDIVEIKPSFFNFPNHPTTWVVQTRKLSQFHRLYGLLYSFSFLPSFIIRYEIENREAIIEMINKRRFVKPK